MKLVVAASVMAIICGIIAFAFRKPKEHAEEYEEPYQGEPDYILPELYTARISYVVSGKSMLGYLVYDGKNAAKRPVVLVAPEWWGLTEFPIQKANQLALLGYVVFVVDFYGNGAVATDPEEARLWATPFYQDTELAVHHLDIAWSLIRTLPVASETDCAVIGYCFGGSMALNYALNGRQVNGVVSFHSGLKVIPSTQGVTAEMLVCHGENDIFVPEETVDEFKRQMIDAGVNFQFTSYPDATHSFTNPGATEMGKRFNMPIMYNQSADQASWRDMLIFFDRIFYQRT